MRQHWHPLPYNNNRTAYRPFGLPMLFVVPIDSTNPQPKLPYRIDIKVLDVPRIATVIGHNNNRRYPDDVLYTETITERDVVLRSTKIDNGTYLARNNCEYILNIGDSYIIDISDVLIDFTDLPDGEYVISYEAVVDEQALDVNGQVICTKDGFFSAITYTEKVQHPGNVMAQFISNVPSAIITTDSLRTEPIVDMMRPFTDVLQNIADEQDVLVRQAFPTDCSPFMIAQLSSMLGWDIPQITQDNISIFRTMLRSISNIQKLRGSVKSFEKFFEIYGNEVGLRYYDKSHAIITPTNVQIVEPCMPPTVLGKFQKFNIPLRNRICISTDGYVKSLNKVTVYAIGTTQENAMDIYDMSNVAVHGRYVGIHNEIVIDSNPSDWITKITYDTYNVTKEVLSGPSLISSIQVTDNSVDIRLDGDLSWSNRTVVLLCAYQTATYDGISNYVDIKVGGGNIPNESYEFVLQYMRLLKPSHMVINNVNVPYSLYDGYVMEDLCFGPGMARTLTSDIGKFEVPFGKIVNYAECVDERDMFTAEDIAYRNKLENIAKEQLTTYNNKISVVSEYSYCRSLILNTWRTGFISKRRREQTQRIFPLTCSNTTNDGFEYSNQETSSYVCYKSNADENITIDINAPIEDIIKSHCGMSWGQNNYYSIPRKLSNLHFITKSNKTYSTKNSVLCDGRWFLDNPISNISTQSIEKLNSAFPGCRPISISNLENDYVSAEYDFRPYDFDKCETIVSGPFTVKGNGIQGDLEESNNSITFVHSVYTATQVRSYDYGVVQGSNVTEHEYLIFDTESNIHGESGLDSIDGYPAQTGSFLWNDEDNTRDYDIDLTGSYNAKFGSCVLDNSKGHKLESCLENDTLSMKLTVRLDEELRHNELLMDGSITI